jgi:hypothetical protein
MLHKIDEDFEDLRFEGKRLASVTEFMETGIEFVVIKGIDHCPPLSWSLIVPRLCPQHN